MNRSVLSNMTRVSIIKTFFQSDHMTTMKLKRFCTDLWLNFVENQSWAHCLHQSVVVVSSSARAEREFSVCSAPTRCCGGGKRYSCVSRPPRFKRQKAISCCQRQITDAAYPLPLILHQQHTRNSKMPVSFDLCLTRRARWRLPEHWAVLIFARKSFLKLHILNLVF